MTQSLKRIEYFDIAKGIGMLAIIAGHFGINQINGFVYTFHVPLFFIISGYFYRDKCNFIRTKARQLLVPYAITAFAVTIILTIEELLKFFIGKVELSSVWDIFIKYVVLSFYGNGGGSNLVLVYRGEYIGAIWFLWGLFWGLVFLRLVVRIKSEPLQFIFSALMLIIGAYTSKYIWLPVSIQSGMCALLFLWVGKMIADHCGMQQIIESKFCLACSAGIWLIAIVFSYKNGCMCLVGSIFPNTILDIGGELQEV